MFTMKFYCYEKNGKVIVENWVMGMKGQTHTHTKESFKQWVKENNINQENITFFKKKEK